MLKLLLFTMNESVVLVLWTLGALSIDRLDIVPDLYPLSVRLGVRVDLKIENKTRC